MAMMIPVFPLTDKDHQAISFSPYFNYYSKAWKVSKTMNSIVLKR